MNVGQNCELNLLLLTNSTVCVIMSMVASYVRVTVSIFCPSRTKSLASEIVSVWSLSEGLAHREKTSINMAFTAACCPQYFP